MGARWSDNDLMALRDLAPAYRAADVGKQLGRSRNAVLLAASRHGVRLRGSHKYLGIIRKPKQAATLKPSVRDLEWAAGFLEGEGAFTVGQTTQRVHGVQVNSDPVRRLQAMFGGAIYEREPTRNNEQRVRIWSVTGARARGVMLTLYGLLSARRQLQIRRALTSSPADAFDITLA